APVVGNPVVSVININSTTFGGVTLAQGIEFSTGTGIQTDIRLGSADLTSTGDLNVLTSFVTPTGSTPIQAFSVANGTPFPVFPPPGFQGFLGFGFFTSQWLSSFTFTST